MKTDLQKLGETDKQSEKEKADAIQAEIANPTTTESRRNFLKKAAVGGIALGGMTHLPVEDVIAETTQKVQRSSKPSDLKITDMRYCEVDRSPAYNQD